MGQVCLLTAQDEAAQDQQFRTYRIFKIAQARFQRTKM